MRHFVLSITCCFSSTRIDFYDYSCTDFYLCFILLVVIVVISATAMLLAVVVVVMVAMLRVGWTWLISVKPSCYNCAEEVKNVLMQQRRKKTT